MMYPNPFHLKWAIGDNVADVKSDICLLCNINQKIQVSNQFCVKKSGSK